MDSFKPYTDVFLTQKRLEGDSSADPFISYIFEDQDKKRMLYQWINELRYNSQISSLPADFVNQTFIADANRLPAWADKKLMVSGSAFFARHAELIMNLLGLLSLPYSYAAANGAMVLYLSGRMNDDVEKRLGETAEFVWEVMAPDAFETDGKGFASILKVRLMHAAARFYTLKSEKWNDDWGFPVNQEDIAGTNLSFSLITIRGLRKLGVTVAYQEQQAFMHLWNVIGYMLGLDEELVPVNGKAAFNLEETIRLRQFQKSEQGTVLTRSLIKYFGTINQGNQFKEKQVVELMRYLLGKSVADIIGLPEAELPRSQIRLLKFANSLKFLTFNDNSVLKYKNELHKFRKERMKFAQKPEKIAFT